MGDLLNNLQSSLKLTDLLDVGIVAFIVILSGSFLATRRVRVVSGAGTPLPV